MSYVLAVDDEPSIRFVYEEFLAGRGHEVRGAASGASAIEHAVGERPCVALVDLNLPDMTGLDVIRELLRIYPDLPVVVISASPRDAYQRALNELGVREFFEKPIDLIELGELAERFAA